jgi:small subunit ribosomal protein S1
MNTPEQPAPSPDQPQPAAPPAAVPGPAPTQQSRPPQPGARRPGGADRPFPGGGGGKKPFPRSDRPRNTGDAPRNLDQREFGAGKPNNRELDKMIEDELNAALGGFSADTALGTPEVPPPTAGGGFAPKPSAAGRKQGRVAGIHGKDVFVDVPGGRGQGVIPVEQFEGQVPKVGDLIEFAIERYDSANGLLLLTRDGAAVYVADWSSVAVNMVVEAKVTDLNKNKTGMLVEVNGIKGFMPISQADMYRVEDPQQFVGQRIKVMVVEVNPEERNLLVSRRALMERERQEKAEAFWKTITEGKVMKGIVRSVKPFGVFVDLGGADGLLPISEISWQRVDNLESLYKVGDTVEVLVRKIDFEARKINLSARALTTSPWDTFSERVKAGARVTGKVTRITDFGAFVELEPGVEGLIHISELSTQRVRRVRDVVEEGQTVEVELLSMDLPNRRMSLSLKTIARAKEDAETEAEQAEREADEKEAAERMANRPVNPNLRGGIGGNQFKYGE